MSGLLFPSDSSDESEEWDDEEMTGPEALLFKKFGALWPTSPMDSQHTLARKTMCPVCSARGWIYIIP